MMGLETCKECDGVGWFQCGWGHYGDCNGDAGEGWKPVISPCPRCGGHGHRLVELPKRHFVKEEQKSLQTVQTMKIVPPDPNAVPDMFS